MLSTEIRNLRSELFRGRIRSHDCLGYLVFKAIMRLVEMLEMWEVQGRRAKTGREVITGWQ